MKRKIIAKVMAWLDVVRAPHNIVVFRESEQFAHVIVGDMVFRVMIPEVGVQWEYCESTGG